ncbi:MAG: hypothetical protein JW818_08895 [Pirellulales bacterium]|nr:hypothetical protein [Pirellulales bacterium]
MNGLAILNSGSAVEYQRRSARRGMGVLLVILMLSVTMAVSYAVLRQQGMTFCLQENADLRAMARQAALSGASEAIRAMHRTDDWTGTESSITKNLGAHQRFTVTFATGDPTLDPESETPSAADMEYPYRVTVTAIGYAEDPNDSSRVASHRIEAVMRLIPLNAQALPSGWSDLTTNTVCQWTAGDNFMVNLGSHIEGNARIRTPLDLCWTEMDWEIDLRWEYVDDLTNYAEANSGSDWRPFTGPVYLRQSSQSTTVWDCLRFPMDANPQDTGTNSAAYCWSDPVSSGTYRLYPGGKEYTVQTLSNGNLGDVQYGPDLLSNPIGLFLVSQELRLNNNVTFEGTVVTSGGADSDLQAYGSGNTMSSFVLPPYEHAPQTGELRFRLPALVSTDDIILHDGARLTIDGMVLAEDDLEVERADQGDIRLQIRGNVAAKDWKLRRREEFGYPDFFWEYWNDLFHDDGDTYWPIWLNTHIGISPVAYIKFLPPSDTIPVRWFDTSTPLFLPHTDDQGLQWDLIRWTEY